MSRNEKGLHKACDSTHEWMVDTMSDEIDLIEQTRIEEREAIRNLPTLIDPSGKARKVHYIPNIDGRGAHAWVRTGLFSKDHQYAAGCHVIENLVSKLEKRGWKRAEQ